MTASPAPRQPLTRSAAARIADASRRVETARTYRRVCSMAKGAKFDHAEPIGPGNSVAKLDWLMADEAPADIIESFTSYTELWAEAAEGEIWVSDSGAASASRLVLARRYRAELRAYGVPVEALLYAEPAGPEAIDYAHELDENGDWFTCPTHHGAVTQDCACSTADFPGGWGMPTASYTEQWAEVRHLAAGLEQLAAVTRAALATEALTKAQREAAEYAAALRTLADLVEATPEVHRYNDFYVWYGSSRGDLAAVTRAALAAGVKVEKDIDETSYNVELRIGPLKVSVLASRHNVCERVVTGTDIVTKSVPDPAYVAEPVPTIEVTETVDRIEWRCTPLLAEVESPA